MNYRCTFSKKTPLDLTTNEEAKQAKEKAGGKKKPIVKKTSSSVSVPQGEGRGMDDDDDRSVVPSEADSDAEDAEMPKDKNR